MEKFKSLICDPDIMKEMLKRVREKYESNPHQRDEERLKAKMYGVTGRIDGLAERISESFQILCLQLRSTSKWNV